MPPARIQQAIQWRPSWLPYGQGQASSGPKCAAQARCAASAICDVDEKCTGGSPTCPGDAVASVAGSTGFIGAPYELGRVVGETGRKFGPYGRSVSVIVSALAGSITAEVSQPSRVGDGADAMSAQQGAAGQALVSEDWIPQRETVMPDEVVRMAATGGVCGSPCYVSRIRCVTGTAVALTVYEGAASTATTLLTATLSAGEEATIPGGRLRAINGVRAAFASGSFDFSIGTEG